MSARAGLVMMFALLVAVPSAAAFAARHDPIDLAYDAQAAPVVVAVGQQTLAGALHGSLLAGAVSPFTASAIPTLLVDVKGPGPVPDESRFASTTLRIEAGTVVWQLGSDAFHVEANAPYGFGLALSQAPLPGSQSEGARPGPGALLAGPQVSATGRWTGAQTQILILDGTVTLLRADGEPVQGWSHRAVNHDATSAADADNATTVFRTQGTFDVASFSTLLAGATGSDANLTLEVHASPRDRFTDALAAISAVGAQLGVGQGKGSPLDPSGPMQNLAPLSGVLNGAILVVNGGNDSKTPLSASMGTGSFDPGPISLLRSGTMSIAWRGAQLRVEGSPAVALTQAGFAVEPAASLGGVVPIVSVILWAGALAAIIVFYVKRPAKVKPRLSLRVLAWLAWLGALALAFLIWDASFSQSFGTSTLALIRSGDLDPLHLSVVFGLEMVPWTLASILFALPIRIMVGVALRIVLPGKPLKSLAKAVGLVGLVTLGPIYALWIVNVGIHQAVAALSH